MISRVLLENWRSHRLSELKFEKGTNVLVGVMGSGKTSIVDALCFALFGTFPNLKSKKLSVSEIVMSKPNKMQKARVELEFDFAGKNYVVERTVFADNKANQARLLENGKLKAGPKPTEVTEEIEKILEIDFELFSRAIYSEQNQIDFFLRLSPQERREKFDQLLELDKYENARANSVQLANALRKSAVEKKRTLQSMKEKFNASELSELLEKIALKEKQLVKVEKEASELLKESEILEKEFNDLEARKKRFESLQTELAKSSGKLEDLEESVKALSAGLEGFEFKDEQSVNARRNALQERLSKMQESKKASEALNSEIEVLNSKKRYLEDEAKAKQAIEPRTLEEVKIEELKNFELSQQLASQQAGLEEQLSMLKEEKGKIEGAIFEQKSFIEELQSLGADALCPTCKRKLEPSHKQDLLDEANLKVSSLEKNLSTSTSNSLNLEVRKKQLLQEIELARQSKSVLEKSRGILQEMRQVLEKIKAASEEVSARQNLLQARKSEFSEQEIEIAENEGKKLEAVSEFLLKKKSLEELSAKISGFKKELSNLNFKPEKFDDLGRTVVEKKSAINALQGEKASMKELLQDLNQRLKSLQSQQEQLQCLESEVSNSLMLSEKLGIFTNALQSTQGELRTHLIQAVNSAMQDVWPRVYPYKDFSSAKIEIVEGNYELMAQARSGSWQRVEGLLSGGERMAAAITIRVAFSLVLAQQLSWLILDEPTHNLDSNSVKVLGSMLKEHLPELVEQVFVITHDKQLENAASSVIFEMLRDKDEDGATRVINKAI